MLDPSNIELARTPGNYFCSRPRYPVYDYPPSRINYVFGLCV